MCFTIQLSGIGILLVSGHFDFLGPEVRGVTDHIVACEDISYDRDVSESGDEDDIPLAVRDQW